MASLSGFARVVCGFRASMRRSFMEGGTGRVWFRLLSRLGEVELKFSDEPGATSVMRCSDGSETIFLVDHCHSEGIDPGKRKGSSAIN